MACWTSPSSASCGTLCLSGLLSSDQRAPLIQRPLGVCERSWAFQSSRRTWSTARWPRRTTWKGSKQTSACGDRLADRLLVGAAHVDQDRADRVAALAELGEERLQRRGVVARRAPHERAGLVIDDAGEVALAAAIGDLVDADRDEAGEPVLVELLGDDTRDDLADGVSPDPQQAGSGSWPSVGPTTPRRLRSRGCDEHPAGPTAPARPARRGSPGT